MGEELASLLECPSSDYNNNNNNNNNNNDGLNLLRTCLDTYVAFSQVIFG